MSRTIAIAALTAALALPSIALAATIEGTHGPAVLTGDDRVRTRDRQADRVDFGPGNDRVIADPMDVLTGCEDVRVRERRGRDRS